jgi:glutaredoxin
MSLIFYTARFCPTCPKVKRWLDSKGIQYEERDAEKIPSECDYYGIQSLPTVRIDEQVLPVGNDLRKLERWLRKNGFE